MPFQRPTLAELRDRAAADIQANLPGTDARLRRSNLDVIAKVNAGAAHGLYGHQAFIAQQIIPDTAEAAYLERWAGVWGVLRLAAAYAAGNVTITGNNGTIVPAGTTLQRSDGAEFTTDDEATISVGTAVVAVTASEAGAAGNTAENSQLTFSSPIVGINGVALVAVDGLSQGADTESDDSLRERLIDRIQQPPHGGASFDYVKWALEVAGVTRAWVYPSELGLGTVTVRFVRDGDVSLIPDAGEVTAVQNYIDERRPVTAAVTVVAPVADVLNFTFSAISPATAAVKSAVEAELRDMLLRDAAPGATIRISHIREAISIAAGEDNYVLTTPNADVAHATGHMATFGAITWP